MTNPDNQGQGDLDKQYRRINGVENCHDKLERLEAKLREVTEKAGLAEGKLDQLRREVERLNALYNGLLKHHEAVMQAVWDESPKLWARVQSDAMPALTPPQEGRRDE